MVNINNDWSFDKNEWIVKELKLVKRRSELSWVRTILCAGSKGVGTHQPVPGENLKI